MFRKVVIASLVILLLLLAFITFAQYQKARELRVPTINKLPPFEYEEQIIKEDNNYLILFRVPEHKYESKSMIGNSKVDLEPYVGKNVRTERDASRMSKKGMYPIMAKVQCIHNKCHPIFKDDPTKEAEVIDIISLSIVRSTVEPTLSPEY